MTADEIPDTPPSFVHVSAMEATCRTTRNGWLWYCDVHDDHGTASTEDEAGFVSDHHMIHREEQDETDECDVVIWQRVDSAGDNSAEKTLVDRIAEAMTGWSLDSCGEEDAEAWRANARAALAVMMEHLS